MPDHTLQIGQIAALLCQQGDESMPSDVGSEMFCHQKFLCNFLQEFSKFFATIGVMDVLPEEVKINTFLFIVAVDF